jgi:hypothetical protein
MHVVFNFLVMMTTKDRGGELSSELNLNLGSVFERIDLHGVGRCPRSGWRQVQLAELSRHPHRPGGTTSHI